MTQDRLLMRATGKNGQIDLHEDYIKITRVVEEEEEEEIFPILKISSIQFSNGKGLFSQKDGFIHFTLLGEKEANDQDKVSKSKFGILFDRNQQAEFEQFKLEAEKRIVAIRIDLLNRPEITTVETKIENEVRTKPDLTKWLEKNTKLLEQGVEYLRDSINKGVDAWAKTQDSKLALERQEKEIGDIQHKRSTYLLAAIIVVIFALSVIALLKNQFELVKWILGSSFAAGAGAGLREILKRTDKGGK